MVISLNCRLLSVNSTNETLLFDRFLIMYDLCVFTCITFIFVFHCTHVRMSYVLNSYLLTYLLKLGKNIHHVSGHCRKGFQGHRSKVKVMIRPSAVMVEECISPVWRRGSHIWLKNYSVGQFVADVFIIFVLRKMLLQFGLLFFAIWLL